MGKVIRLALLLCLVNIGILLSYPKYNNRIIKTSFDYQKNCDISHSNSSTFLWSINTWPVSYLFGTIHVPYTQVWPHVSLAVRESFRNADRIFFELDLTDERNHRDLIECQILPRNDTVENYLDAITIKSIDNLLARYRDQKLNTLSYDKRIMFKSRYENLTRFWKKKRPFWLLIMLNDLMKTPNNEVAVLDLYLAQESLRMKKEVGSVEDVSDQCNPINSIPYPHVAKWIRKTVKSIEMKSFFKVDRDKSLDDLIKLYNCGDPSMVKHTENKLPTISLEDLGESNRVIEEDLEDESIKGAIYHNMVVKRNEKMANNIVKELEKAMKQGKSAFFAIGAGHFFGNNDTILDFLRKHGYEMTPILRNNLTNIYPNRYHQNRQPSRQRPHFTKVNPHQIRFQPKHMEISMPDDGTLLLDESEELPKFKPRFINFQNNYMTIEEFNSKGMVITDQSTTQKYTQQGKNIERSAGVQLNFLFWLMFVPICQIIL